MNANQEHKSQDNKKKLNWMPDAKDWYAVGKFVSSAISKTGEAIAKTGSWGVDTFNTQISKEEEKKAKQQEQEQGSSKQINKDSLENKDLHDK